MSNKTFSQILYKNEKDANKTVANVMLITLAMFTIIYILNLLDVFIIESCFMNTAYFVSVALLSLPAIVNKVYDTSSKKLKYIYVTPASLFVLAVTSTLSYHVVILSILGKKPPTSKR